MRKSLFVVALSLLIASRAFAEMATYPGEFALKNLSTGKQEGSASCTVRQNLSWEDYRVFTTCRFNGKQDVISYAGTPNAAGYDYDLQLSYIKLDLNSDKGLGKYLLDNLSLSNLSGTNEMQVYFGPDQPFTHDKAMFTAPNGDLVELSLIPGKYQ